MKSEVDFCCCCVLIDRCLLSGGSCWSSSVRSITIRNDSKFVRGIQNFGGPIQLFKNSFLPLVERCCCCCCPSCAGACTPHGNASLFVLLILCFLVLMTNYREEMPSFWSQGGYSYMKYASLCARLLRNTLKPEYRHLVAAREKGQFNITQWSNGKPASKPGTPLCSSTQ